LSVAIIGLGNILLRDEGVGVHVINKLRHEYEIPPSVRLIDGGTMGLDLLPFIEESEKVLIIDAVDFKKEPGTIEIIEGERIPGFLSSKLSVHQIGLADVMFAMRLRGRAPSEMCVIGIQPESVETGIGLSEKIDSCITPLIGKVREKLMSWGIVFLPKK